MRPRFRSGQVPAEAAAAVRAGRRDCRRGACGWRRGYRMEAGRPVDCGAGVRRACRAGRRPRRPRNPAAARAQLRAGLGAAADLCDRDSDLDKYQLKPQRPFAPGGEIAGEVLAAGDGVTGWKPGDRLIAALGFGGLAEQVVVPADRAIPLPPERSFEQGSALLMTYATAIPIWTSTS